MHGQLHIRFRGNDFYGVQGFHGVRGEGFRPCRMLHHVSVHVVTDVLVGPGASIPSVVTDKSTWLMWKTKFCVCGKSEFSVSVLWARIVNEVTSVHCFP